MAWSCLALAPYLLGLCTSQTNWHRWLPPRTIDAGHQVSGLPTQDAELCRLVFDNGRFLLFEEAITPDHCITRMHTTIYMSRT
jgi:hypothetical protein